MPQRTARSPADTPTWTEKVLSHDAYAALSWRLYTATVPISEPGGTCTLTQLVFGLVTAEPHLVLKTPSMTLDASQPAA